MSKRIEYQLIEQGGKPAFAVIPYDVFVEEVLGGVEPVSLPDGDPGGLIPHAVAKRTITGEASLLQAWREHLGLTQAELAHRMGVTQSAVSQMERVGARRPHRATLEKAATAMGLAVDQLIE
jgi:DNA-binding XRE family transcriptional regulator